MKRKYINKSCAGLRDWRNKVMHTYLIVHRKYRDKGLCLEVGQKKTKADPKIKAKRMEGEQSK